MKLMITTLLICSFGVSYSVAVEARSKNLDYVRSYFEKENKQSADTIKPRRPTSLPKKKINRKVAGQKSPVKKSKKSKKR